MFMYKLNKYNIILGRNNDSFTMNGDMEYDFGKKLYLLVNSFNIFFEFLKRFHNEMLKILNNGRKTVKFEETII